MWNKKNDNFYSLSFLILSFWVIICNHSKAQFFYHSMCEQAPSEIPILSRKHYCNAPVNQNYSAFFQLNDLCKEISICYRMIFFHRSTQVLGKLWKGNFFHVKDVIFGYSSGDRNLYHYLQFSVRALLWETKVQAVTCLTQNKDLGMNQELCWTPTCPRFS